MIPLTTADAQLGGFIIGFVACLAGMGIMRLARSGIYDWWCARKAERIVTETDAEKTARLQAAAAAPFAPELTDGEDEYREYREHHWSDAMDAHCDQSLAIAKHNLDAFDKVSPLPGRRLASVPDQGKPSGWS